MNFREVLLGVVALVIILLASGFDVMLGN